MLRDGHGLRNRHPQLAPRLLLQRGGREGRRGIALHGLLLDLGHREGRADAASEERLGLLARLEARRQLGLEERPILVPGSMELRHDAEIGGRPEGDDLAFALDEQPHGDALHAARRQRRPHLLPQHGRQLETDQTIQHAARLLGVDQIHVDRPRVLDSLQNGPLRNFVEDDPLRPLDRETQHFGQVPCDGLSFAVFIGGEPHSPVLRGAREFVHDLAFILRDLVDRREPVGEIDSQILFREVANMAEARLDHEILTQELLDRFGLGRRLDDN